MAKKMGFESTIAEVEKKNPGKGVSLRKVIFSVEDLKKYGLRRPNNIEDSAKVPAWCLAIGEEGEGGVTKYFYAYGMLEVAKKALGTEEA